MSYFLTPPWLKMSGTNSSWKQNGFPSYGWASRASLPLCMLKELVLPVTSETKGWQRRAIPFWNTGLPWVQLTWKAKHQPGFDKCACGIIHPLSPQKLWCYLWTLGSCDIFHKDRRLATLFLDRASCLPLLCLMGFSCCLLQSWLHFMLLQVNSCKKNLELREWKALCSSYRYIKHKASLHAKNILTQWTHIYSS